MRIPEYYKFFNKTRIISGNRALENIPYELQSMDSVKPLVITDRKTVKDGVVKTLIGAYGDSGCVIGGVYDGVTEYASVTTVLDAAGLYRDRGCDSIIAIGGENAASVAKGVNLLVSHRTDDLMQFESLPDTMNLRPLIVIITSDSGGRETSTSGVIAGRVFDSDELMPDIAVIDPRMLKKRGSAETIVNSLGAMAEAIEACTEEVANPMNDSFAFAAIQLIHENLSKTMNGRCSRKERLGLANGIAISGIVSSNAPEGLCTALAGELARSTGNSRALLAAVILPYVLEYKLKHAKGGVRGELLLPLAGIDGYCASAENDRGRLGVEAVVDTVRSFGRDIPVSLGELKIPRYLIERAAEAAEERFAPQYGKGGCKKILEAAMNGGVVRGGKK